MNPSPPGPPGRWLTGSLADFRRDPLAFFVEMQATYGDVVAIRLAGTRSVLATHPDDVRRVLKTNRKGYSKRTRGIHRLREILGDGLLTIIDKDRWLFHRRTMQPVFRPSRVDVFVSAISSLTESMLDDWRGVVPAAPAMTRLTLQVAGRCFFGSELDGTDEIGRAFVELMEINQRRFRRAINAPLTWPSAENRRFHAALGRLDERMLELVRHRRQHPGDDLLSMLMEARDEETNEGLSESQLRDEAITLLGAGHETTANALVMILDLLARHPEAYARIRQESQAAWGQGPPALDDLRRLPWTTACIREGLRLNPPAWVFGRLAIEPDVLGGYAIPAGTLVMMSPFVTHRRADLWDDPLAFRPERFLEEDPKRHPFAFHPFGGGPRMCIGQHFAHMEMQVVVATIARRIGRLRRVHPEVEGWRPLVTLRPVDDVPLRVG